MEAAYRKEGDGAFKLRVLLMLLLAQGKDLKEIGSLLRISDETVRRWFHRYLLEGIAGLHTRPRKGRPPKFKEEERAFLLKAVEMEPRALGINSTNWTTGLLSLYLERERGIRVTPEAIRIFLRNAGFALKRPSPVVISPDPQYGQKRGK